MSSNVKKLLTRQGVADHCGLSLNTVKMYRSNGDMPEPDIRHGRTPLWYEATIIKWRKDFRPYEKGGKA